MGSEKLNKAHKIRKLIKEFRNGWSVWLVRKSVSQKLKIVSLNFVLRNS
jgi:hypothetical protein